MAIAKQGDTVKVHYVGRLDDGTVFDSSEGREPIEFTLGEGQVIPGFEKAVEGLEVGEKTTTQIPPTEAYGPRSDELVLTVQRDQFPEGVEPAVGQGFEMRTDEGRTVRVRVTGTDGDTVEVDANHPLAGRELIFDLELSGIT